MSNLETTQKANYKKENECSVVNYKPDTWGATECHAKGRSSQCLLRYEQAGTSCLHLLPQDNSSSGMCCNNSSCYKNCWIPILQKCQKLFQEKRSNYSCKILNHVLTSENKCTSIKNFVLIVRGFFLKLCACVCACTHTFI